MSNTLKTTLLLGCLTGLLLWIGQYFGGARGMAGMLVVGWIANLLVRPVNPKWHMSEAEVQAAQAKLKLVTAAAGQTGSFGIGKGGLDGKAAAFWLLVGLPLAWGVWNTVVKTLVLLK